jgi:hypothetical protein
MVRKGGKTSQDPEIQETTTEERLEERPTHNEPDESDKDSVMPVRETKNSPKHDKIVKESDNL